MKPITSVCIVGAGSIGCIYAGFLSSVATVKVLTHREEQANALRSEGLTVSGKSELHGNVAASVSPKDLGEADLVIVATKTFDVESAIAKIAGHFPSALLMLIQNGMGCEKIAQKFGTWPIISAVAFMAGTRISDTQVEYEVDTPTWLGPWHGSTANFSAARQIAELFARSGLRAEAFEDVLPAQWSKLIFNATVNSVSAITDLPFSSRFTNTTNASDLGNLVFGAIDEGKQVASALGIELLQDPWLMCHNAAAQLTDEDGCERVPSMLRDIRAHRNTEVDWITGEVVRQASDAGIEVPIISSLYRLVKAREASWSQSNSQGTIPELVCPVEEQASHRDLADKSGGSL